MQGKPKYYDIDDDKNPLKYEDLPQQSVVKRYQQIK